MNIELVVPKKDDPDFIRVQQMLDRQSALVVQPVMNQKKNFTPKIFQILQVMGLYLALPFTTNLPFVRSAWRELLDIRDTFWAFLEGHIEVEKMKLKKIF